MMAPLLLALAVASAAVSPSKLGVVVARDLTAADTVSGGILAACPRLAVFPLDGTNGGAVTARITAYRTVCPSGIVAVELAALGTTVDGSTVPTWWPVWFQQIVTARLGGRVDVIVGPPDPAGTNGSPDVAAFWAAFAQTIAASGLGAMPVMGATPPGMLGLLGTGEGVPPSLAALCASLRAANATGVAFGWASHALPGVSPPFGADFIYGHLSSYCGVAGTPVFVTRIDPRSGDWQPSDLTWLSALDAELAKDGSVQGAALFALGGTTDLTSIAAPLATYLEYAGTPGGGDTSGGSNGGGTIAPSPGTTDTLSPSSPKQGCATAGSAVAWLGLLPLLRRRLRE